ncbi:alpha/beta fold hydrolase [Amycolatopsis sp. lyj-109]|uniref:alpha/beta fold hydrolase n=1 Tax=Amycolatopsis sp. lyj-109 TaxID=2789287 RepID=UPI003979F8BE
MNVTSADGTTIHFERRGSGAPVILVGGAFNDRTTVAGLAEVLAGDFTTIAYDRRGRGDSGDSAEYAVEREIEDLAALIAQVGGTASVFGHSSGAILALEAAAAGLPIGKLVAYEPPYTVADRTPSADDLVDRVRAANEAGDRDEAVRLFLVEGAGTPAQAIDGMKADPVWGWFTALAHTLPYDLTIVGPGGRLPADRLARISAPTLVIDGSESPSWFGATARAVAEAVPGARHETLDGQDHGVLQYPETLRPLLTDFLK